MPAPLAVRIRAAVDADLDRCCAIWKAGIDDYHVRLNQPAAPDDLTGLHRLLTHVLATDPNRFLVAERNEQVIAFGSATVRGDLWFLGMLFVEPGHQADGLGGMLLERLMAPDGQTVHRWGTCTDSVQPISNALYARRGIVPRVPIWRLIGEIRDMAAFPPLPPGLRMAPFASLARSGPDGHGRLADLVNGLDRAVLGFEHSQDHALLRRDERQGFVLSGPNGAPLGYGYASAVGRVGPILAVEPAHVAPILGWLVANVPANGARAVWLPGTTDAAFAGALRAGLRLDGFPGLLCWSTRDHPFDRYVPISLALV